MKINKVEIAEEDKIAIHRWGLIFSSCAQHESWTRFEGLQNGADRLGALSHWLGLLGMAASKAYPHQAHVIASSLGWVAKKTILDNAAHIDPRFIKGSSIEWDLRRPMVIIIRNYLRDDVLTDFMVDLAGEEGYGHEQSVWSMLADYHLRKISPTPKEQKERLELLQISAKQWLSLTQDARNAVLTKDQLSTALDQNLQSCDQSFQGHALSGEKAHQMSLHLAQSITLASPARFESDLQALIQKLEFQRHLKTPSNQALSDQVSMMTLKLASIFHGLYREDPDSPSSARYQAVSEAMLSWFFKVNPKVSAPLEFAPHMMKEEAMFIPANQAVTGSEDSVNVMQTPLLINALGVAGEGRSSLPGFTKPAIELLFMMIKEPRLGHDELPQEKMLECQAHDQVWKILQLESLVKMPTRGHSFSSAAKIATASLLKLMKTPSQGLQAQLIDACQTLAVELEKSTAPSTAVISSDSIPIQKDARMSSDRLDPLLDSSEGSNPVIHFIKMGFLELQASWLQDHHHLLEWEAFAQDIDKAGLKRFTGIKDMSQLEAESFDHMKSIEISPLAKMKEGLQDLINEQIIAKNDFTDLMSAHLESCVGRVKAQLEAWELRELIKPKGLSFSNEPVAKPSSRRSL